MNKLQLILFSITLTLILSCSEKNDKISNKKTSELIVSWFSGYTMPQLLEENFEINTIEDLKTILNKKWYGEFSVYSPSEPDKKYTMLSCQSLFKLGQLKLFTVRERDNAPFMSISAMCNASKLIANGLPAKETFLSDIKFDKNLPNLLPAQIGMVLSTTESNKLFSDKKNKYWFQINKISRVEIKNSEQAIYHNTGGSQELQLVAKGDFNNDGIEDIIITSNDSVVGGSYSATRLFVLTRLSLDSDIQLLNLP